MIYLFENAAQIITVDTGGINSKPGSQMKNIGILTNHSIVVENGIIKDFVKSGGKKRSIDKKIDLRKKTLMPGFVECHTHTAFAGSRSNEFRQKLSGVGYEEIAKNGGGINTTVKAVRNSTFDELLQIIQPRIDYFISQGITTLEIKSGYGLSFYDEIKLLQVINQLNRNNPIEIVATFLGAHTYPNEYNNDHVKYNEIIINEMLPYIAENKLAEFCDAFCEVTAFSADEVDKIFSAAAKHGLKLKLHTEQFNNIGGLDVALNHQAVSVDHLEVISDSDTNKMVDTNTVSVLLPGVSFFLNYNYAPARKLIDKGATVALSTDFNPGSSHISNLNLIMSLAALKMNMSIEETISAVTINAAKAINRNQSTGSLEIGKKADFSVFDTEDFSDIVYQVGKNLNCITVKEGEIIYSR
ncbi:MAG: imidazolonepropionase [Ignavibacteriae bacterium HGW-Ignavibacteriae-2]|jgi:imidazolonepropionase|nr:MAG: imidazolonepropionase [Ignavibacteriae bacterium HGW-Ignavibacteriae-2]